jgi:hypothetical protein
MNAKQIEYCRSRIDEEEKLAREAPSGGGEAHRQLAMLYKAQIAVLSRDWNHRSPGEH